MSLHAASQPHRRAWFLAALLAAASIAAFAPRAFGQAVATEPPAAWAACDVATTSAGAVDPVDPALATFCASVRTERAMQALSRRYSELWARLPNEQRSEFSVAERRWLSSGRYAERDACVAHHSKSGVVQAAGLVSADLLAAECLAQVTARRLAQVEVRHAAMQPAVSAR